MTWDGFKKGLNRVGISLLQMTGNVEKTVDGQYGACEDVLKEYQTKVEDSQKEAKAYLDSVRAACSIQGRISEHFSQIFVETSSVQVARQAKKLHDLLKLLEEQTRLEFDEAFRATVLEPLTHYAVLYPDIVDMTKKRGKKLLDYDAAKAHVKRLVDKPSTDSTKLPKAEADESAAREAYETLNTQLKDGIPHFIGLRTNYLGPSVDSLFALQLMLVNDYNRQLETIKVSGKADLEAESALEELRSLSIVSA